jgi:maltose O-acetyltransferase
VKVWSVNHRFDDPDQPWLLQGWELKPVVIEDDVWLGANVFIMPGVTIGKGAIVSACAVLSRSVPPYSLVAGNPARVVGWRKQPPAAAAPPPAPKELHA